MTGSRRVLVLTGGHKIDDASFTRIIDRLAAERGWVVRRAARDLGAELADRTTQDFDAVLMYDLPGLALSLGSAPTPAGPGPETVDAIADLLEAGTGLVVLHHALAGWPAWPGWADAIGGRFHYRPARLRGRAHEDSGYYHGRFRARVVDESHPVTAGVESLELEDELYAAVVFEDDVHPLVRLESVPPTSDYRSAFDAVLRRPQRDGWCCPVPSDLLGWSTTAGSSPVVTLLPGDGGGTLLNDDYARLVGNSVDWVLSSDARQAAAAAPRPIDRNIDDSLIRVNGR
ncbi:ThuA domain-containing protein [Dietzia lutea]|uniref:ThuA-like domain-containing protein n=1 Tax=Dietzia lutea TaxID=546160 RepID=A0A2S1R9W1_9ACTN|nr:ThuA domain-containing protein [Dietzia lutea]AWH93077.1 hypothetical protein A6035_13865 [Dietzia lutea]